ncbi:MAG: Maf family nucleotide pyrophosphatase [Pseudomonadota bacterium]
MSAQLVLASASPRRRDLLAQIGVVPDAIEPADLDETPRPGELPRPYAERLAREKAEAVHSEGQFTLSGDTVVAMGRRILPKAACDADVEDCLNRLSGRAHHVMSAICLIAPDGRTNMRLSDSRVVLKRLSAIEIAAYVRSHEGIGKAGGYGIQGRAGAFVKQIQGSYSGIVGLPLFDVANLLHGLGYPTQAKSSQKA